MNTKAQIRKEIGANQQYYLISTDFLDSKRYMTLPVSAKILYHDLCFQYSDEIFDGKEKDENVYLTISFPVMKERGWKSPTTLHKAKKELLERQIITVVQSQRGASGAIMYIFDDNVKPVDVDET